eukprot:m.56279 g.56279  ORF g.56279 m.56279 type:complete len:197 (+) comp11550_c0_seq1:52-642(+)
MMQMGEGDSTAAVSDAGGDGPNLDPRLDMTSPQFDAKLVLDTEGVPVPYPNVKALDTIAQWKAIATGKKSSASSRAEKKPVQEIHDPHLIPRAKPLPTVQERKERHKDTLLPGKKVRKRSNVLDIIKRTNWDELGPISVLYHCMHDAAPVRVVLRGYQKGQVMNCVGYLVAFDGRFNMVLRSVTRTRTIPVWKPRR